MDQVSQIREKVDIVSFISEYIPVKKAGRNFNALCPFHGEKSPSFVVSPERQIWHCFGCFPPGTKIKTPFGYHKIEEIDENHWVVSGKGNLRKTLQVMDHQYNGELVTVKLRKLHEQVRLTTDHMVFAIRGATYTQKKYKDFSKRYRKYLTLRETDKKRYYQLANKYFPIKEIPAGELQKGDLLLYPINRNITDIEVFDLTSYISKFTNFGPIPKKIPLQIRVEEKFLKLLGYYIAEGSGHRAYIRFSLGNHEEQFALEIVQLIHELFGLDAKIYRRQKGQKTGIEITACHAKLANIFENLCGKGAENKHIPFIMQELPTDKQSILLNAIFRGDGHMFIPNRSHSKHKAITTISRILAEQLTDILLRLNIFPTQYIGKAHIDKSGVNHREAYSIFWSEEAKQKYSLVYYQPDGSEYWLLPIIELGRQKYNGPVYNFTVDQDHSYIATNFAVANCGKGGDAYTFLMEYEHMEFPEALRFLAKRTGIQLASASYADTEASAKKERLYRINSLAVEYYHFILMQHPAGKEALDYVKGRGIDDRLLNTFKLGFAPSSGRALSRYLLQKKQYEQEDILDAGLAFARGREISDFFRGRLIFPLIDHRDNVLGFSGRLLDEKNGFGGKYINTRDTLIYHKREHFFGINITKEAIRKEKQAIVLEGEFDVMTCFQHGISNVVAVKGTALTEQQVNLLHRYAEKVTMCFDGDAAGQEAIKRSLPVLSKKGLQATVIIIPSGKDPDEALKTDAIAFKKAVAQDINVYDYLFTQAFQKYSPDSPEGKGKIAEEILPMLQDIDNAIVKEHYLRKLSTGIKTTYDSILKELERWEKQRVVRQDVVPVAKKSRSREETMEEYLLALVMQGKQPMRGLGMWEKVKGFHSQANASDKLLTHLAAFLQNNRQGFDQKMFSLSVPAELIEAYNTAVLFPLPQFTDASKEQQEIEKVVQQLKTLYIKEKMKLLSEQIKQQEQAGKEEEVERLKKEYSEIVANLKISS